MSPMLKKSSMLAAPCAAMLNRAVRPAARTLLNGPPAKCFSTVSADVSNELEQIAKKYISEISEKDLKTYVLDINSTDKDSRRERLTTYLPEQVEKWEGNKAATFEDCIGIAIEASRRIQIPKMQEEKGTYWFINIVT